MSGTLYLLPNVLGDPTTNLCDFSIPKEVQNITTRLDYFIAENAKTTRAFLKQLSQIHPLTTPLQEIVIQELNINTPSTTLPTLLDPILKGKNAGLISEAGVPSVADPGANLVRLAHQRHICVRPMVGPSSLLLAIMASGLNGQSFAFNGYLPIDNAQKIKQIKLFEERSRKENQTQFFIETPYRNASLLETLTQTCANDTLICVATHLTLPDEWVYTQKASAWKMDLKQGKIPLFHKKPTVFLLLAQ